MKKIILFTSMVVLGIGSANAQLGGLVNAVKNKAKQEIINKKNDVKNNVKNNINSTINKTVEQSANLITTGSFGNLSSSSIIPNALEKTGSKIKVPANKPAEVTVNSNIDDIYKALFFYLDLNNQAIEANDVSYLCTLDAEKPFDILYHVLNNHPNRNKPAAGGNTQAVAEHKYNQMAKQRLAILGQPTIPKEGSDFEKYVSQQDWYLSKINKTEDLDIQGYYLANALAITKFAIEGKSKTLNATTMQTNEYQAIAARLNEVWGNMSNEYKEKYKHLEGVTTVDGVAAANKVLKARWAQEEADAQKADIENIKANLEDMPKPAWKNPTLAAQCRQVAQKKSDVKFVDAVLMSPEWQYDYQWGRPIRRRVHAWCIYKMNNGYYKAIQISFKQMNTGGGNYGPLEVNAMYPSSFKYVRYK